MNGQMLHVHSALCSWSPVGAQIVKEKQRFQRVVVSREEALAMFQENKFKVEIITGLPEDATISLYRCARHPQPLCTASIAARSSVIGP